MIQNEKVSFKNFAMEECMDFWRNLIFFVQYRRGWGNSSTYVCHLNYWRRMIFMIKSILHPQVMAEVFDFFMDSSLRMTIIKGNTCILEQLIRPWFYYGSIMRERVSLVKESFEFFEKKLSPQALQKIYLGDGILLWTQPYKNQKLSLVLDFKRSHRKEGLMTLTLMLNEKKIYLTTFWIASDSKGKKSLWLGAFQGTKGDLQINRELTKYFCGYRPKNLVMYALRIFAQQLEIEKIYAVSNLGFQASHHISAKRRLKTSLDNFWQEIQGQISSDSRFFALPLSDVRKNMENITSQKRNLYRKRFIMLDGIKAAIAKELTPYLM